MPLTLARHRARYDRTPSAARHRASRRSGAIAARPVRAPLSASQRRAGTSSRAASIAARSFRAATPLRSKPSIFGEGRAADEAQVFFALRMLLARICADLERCGKRAGALRLAIELEDADACELRRAARDADGARAHDVRHAARQARRRDLSAAIVGLRVQARQLEEGGEAQALFCADDLDPQRVAVTIARLEAVLGESVARAQTREAHLLEERFRLRAVHAAAGSRMFAKRARQSELVPQLRLLDVREVPVQLRGGEPAIVDRQAVRAMRRSVAHRRTLPTIASPVTRDEYDVVLEDGTFARIYRQGRIGTSAACTTE